MNLMFALSPFILLALGALLLMLAEAFAKTDRGLAIGASFVLFWTSAVAGGVWLYGADRLEGLDALAPWLIIDRFTLFFNMLIPLGAGIVSLLAGGYLEEHRMNRGEFYTLLMFTTFGAMMLASAGDLLTLMLGLETMSIGAYALTAFRRTSPRSAEGGIKYFLLGSFSAALMLYGFALLYGATGHTDLVGLGSEVAKHSGDPRVILALVLVLSGIVFKVSGVPFHMWAPDAYEGAPTPATTLMAATIKAGGFAMAIRLLTVVFGDPQSTSWSSGWPPVLAWIAVLTMTVGNLIAGRQDSVKRMLAYSSIVHAGYMIMALVTFGRTGAEAVSGILMYLLTYTVSTVGAFGALMMTGSFGKEAVSFSDLAGIGRRHPAIALPFALFLLSLAGIPPTAGFFGKWYVFKTAIDGGYYLLAIVGFLNSVLGAYYYLRVLVYMYMREPGAGAPVAVPMRSKSVAGAVLLSAILVVILGIQPGMSIDVVEKAAGISTGM